MLMIGYVFGQAQLFSPVRELHNVSVLEQRDANVFTVAIPAKDNPPRTHDQAETWRFCAWGDELPLKPGMVMTVVQYKQKRNCQLIDSQTDVKYLRDSVGNVVDVHGDILFAKGD